MALPDRFRAFVEEHGLLRPGERVVVGVSGGVDSTVLLGLLRGRFEPVAAHVNYRLRGAASDGDEAFVHALCEQWDVPLQVRRLDAPLAGPSVQAAAREVRYDFFEAVAREAGAAAVATAHHRDDQAETVLLNLFRGTGPEGLAGMPVRRPIRPGSPVHVVRPLLFAPRAEIEAYARAEGLAWREDASNASGDYRRSALRRDVLPLIEEHFGPGVSERIAGAADRLRALLDAEAPVAAALAGATERVGEGWALRTEALRALAPGLRRAVLAEALRAWLPAGPRSEPAVNALEALVDAQPGRHVVWPAATVWRDRGRLVFTEAVPVATPEEARLGIGDAAETADGTLRVEALPNGVAAPDADPNVEVVDADRLRFPLTLRPWRPGDALVPIGMDGRKKVSDLLTERRVPPQARTRQRVLLSGAEVVWVVGHRLAAPFRLRPETARAVRLVWEPGAESR